MNRRALYVFNGKLNGTGLDRVAQEQILALAKAGWEVEQVSRGRIDHPRVRNICWRYTPANLFSMFSAKLYYRLQNRFFSWLGAQRLRAGRYGLVIGWTRQSLRLFRVAKPIGIPCLLNCPGPHYRFSADPANPLPLRPWPAMRPQDMEEEYRLAHGLLLTSEHAHQSFLGNGYPSERLTIIGRGVDLECFEPVEKTPRPFRLIFCGRVDERKGAPQVLAAWKRAALETAELWFVGNIPNELEDKLREAAPANVRFWGQRKDVNKLLPQCHAQILLSRSEGMAKALIEGAACGLATVCTATCGFPIENGVNGYLVERDDIETVAARLKQLYENVEACHAMGEYALQWARQSQSWEAFRGRFLEAVQHHLTSWAT